MIRTLATILALGALAVPLTACETCGCRDAKKAEAKHEHIHAADLKKLVDAKTVVLIDCNGSDSFKAGHIPGAIDFAANKDKLAELLPKDKGALIVAYCGSTKCSAHKAGAAAAVALGYTNVTSFEEGLAGWKEAGYALEK
jgi:rhodanese-related sulfurtransferase